MAGEPGPVRHGGDSVLTFGSYVSLWCAGAHDGEADAALHAATSRAALPTGVAAETDGNGVAGHWGEEVSGHLCAKGFSDVSLYLESAFNKKTASVGAAATAPLFRDCVFEIVPREQHLASRWHSSSSASGAVSGGSTDRVGFRSSRRSVQRATDALDESGDATLEDDVGNGDPGRDEASETGEQESEEARDVAAMVELEKRQNAQNAADMRGKPIQFGSIVQLRHVNSSKFVTARPFSLARDKECIALELDTSGDDGSHFILRPRFKHRSRGDLVRYSDEILLESPGLRMFLHTSSTEVNLSSHTTPWKIQLFSTHQVATGRFIRGGDAVRLVHYEVEASLVATTDSRRTKRERHDSQAAEMKSTRVYLRSSGTGGAGSSDGAGSGAADADSSDPAAGTNALWELEAPDPTDGSELRWGSSLHLRHLNSGKYLALRLKSMIKAEDQGMGEPDTPQVVQHKATTEGGGGGGGAAESKSELSEAVLDEIMGVGDQSDEYSDVDDSLGISSDSEPEKPGAGGAADPEASVSFAMGGPGDELDALAISGLDGGPSVDLGAYQLCLTNVADGDAKFSLHPPGVRPRTSRIARESSVLIRHSSGLWLHSSRDMLVSRQRGSFRARPGADSAAGKPSGKAGQRNGGEWTSEAREAVGARSRKFRVGARPEVGQEDAFQLAAVPRKDMEETLFLLSSMPCLQQFIRAFHRTPEERTAYMRAAGVMLGHMKALQNHRESALNRAQELLTKRKEEGMGAEEARAAAAVEAGNDRDESKGEEKDTVPALKSGPTGSTDFTTGTSETAEQRAAAAEARRHANKIAALLNEVELPIDADGISLTQQVMLDLMKFVCGPGGGDPLGDIMAVSPVKRRQRLLAEHGVESLLVQVLTAPFDRWGGILSLTLVPPEIARICRYAYRLLHLIFLNDRTNEMRVARHMSVFVAQLGQDFGASATLTALLTDNISLIEQLSSRHVRVFFTLIRTEGRRPEFVEFLAALCSCLGHGVSQKQELLTDLIFGNADGAYTDADSKVLGVTQHAAAGSDIVIPVRVMNVRGSHQQLLHVNVALDTPGRKTSIFRKWIPMRQLYTKNHRLASYFTASLHLFTEMCRSRNYVAIREIREMFPRDALYQAIGDNMVPPRVRAAFVRLLDVMYVDCKPYNPVPIAEQTRLWDSLGKPPRPRLRRAPALLNNTSERLWFGELSDFLLAYFQSLNGILVRTKSEQNELTQALLDLCHRMLTFGLFGSATREAAGSRRQSLEAEFDEEQEQLAQLVRPLILLLDGRNDDMQLKLLGKGKPTEQRRLTLRDADHAVMIGSPREGDARLSRDLSARLPLGRRESEPHEGARDGQPPQLRRKLTLKSVVRATTMATSNFASDVGTTVKAFVNSDAEGRRADESAEHGRELRAMIQNLRNATMRRYAVSRNSHRVIKVKAVVCEVLKFVLQLRLDYSLQLVLSAFYRGRSLFSSDANNRMGHGWRDGLPNLAIPNLAGVGGAQGQSIVGSPKSFVSARRPTMQGLRASGAAGRHAQPRSVAHLLQEVHEALRVDRFGLDRLSGLNVVGVLLDLLMYQDAHLTAVATELLVQHYTRFGMLRRALSSIELLVAPSTAGAYRRARALLPKLQILVETSEVWMGMETFSDRRFESRARIIMHILTKAMWLTKSDIELDMRADARGASSLDDVSEEEDADGSGTVEAARFASEKTGHDDVLASSGDITDSLGVVPVGELADEEIGHYDESYLCVLSERQRIMRTLGVPELVVSLMKSGDETVKARQDSGRFNEALRFHMFHMMSLAHRFLLTFLVGNTDPAAQELLTSKAELITSLVSDNLIGADLLGEIYQHSSQLVFEVKPTFPRRIVHAIATHGLIPAMLMPLESLVVFKGTPVLSNILMVLSAIQERLHDVAPLRFLQVRSPGSLSERSASFRSLSKSTDVAGESNRPSPIMTRVPSRRMRASASFRDPMSSTLLRSTPDGLAEITALAGEPGARDRLAAEYLCVSMDGSDAVPPGTPSLAAQTSGGSCVESPTSRASSDTEDDDETDVVMDLPGATAPRRSKRGSIQMTSLQGHEGAPDPQPTTSTVSEFGGSVQVNRFSRVANSMGHSQRKLVLSRPSTFHAPTVVAKPADKKTTPALAGGKKPSLRAADSFFEVSTVDVAAAHDDALAIATEVCTPAPLLYWVRFLNLCAILGGGREFQSEVKLQSMMDLDLLLSAVSVDGMPLPIRGRLLDTLAAVWIDTERPSVRVRGHAGLMLFFSHQFVRLIDIFSDMSGNGGDGVGVEVNCGLLARPPVASETTGASEKRAAEGVEAVAAALARDSSTAEDSIRARMKEIVDETQARDFWRANPPSANLLRSGRASRSLTPVLERRRSLSSSPQNRVTAQTPPAEIPLPQLWRDVHAVELTYLFRSLIPAVMEYVLTYVDADDVQVVELEMVSAVLHGLARFVQRPPAPFRRVPLEKSEGDDILRLAALLGQVIQSHANASSDAPKYSVASLAIGAFDRFVPSSREVRNVARHNSTDGGLGGATDASGNPDDGDGDLVAGLVMGAAQHVSVSGRMMGTPGVPVQRKDIRGAQSPAVTGISAGPKHGGGSHTEIATSRDKRAAEVENRFQEFLNALWESHAIELPDDLHAHEGGGDTHGDADAEFLTIVEAVFNVTGNIQGDLLPDGDNTLKEAPAKGVDALSRMDSKMFRPGSQHNMRLAAAASRNAPPVATAVREPSEVPVVTFEDLMRRLIEFADDLGQEDNPGPLFVVLRIIREVLSARSHRMRSMQRRLTKLGAIRMILHQFALPRKSGKLTMDLRNALVSTAIALMDGGNPTVQRAFAECLAEDPAPLPLWHKLLRRSTARLVEVPTELPHTGNGAAVPVASSDSAGGGMPLRGLSHVDDLGRAVSNSLLLLRLLQVSCEGHNALLQNFLRDQSTVTHSGGRSVNLVEAAATVLYEIHDRLGGDKRIVEVAVQALDTLVEMIQGPCAENQLALVNAKFVEVVGRVLSSEARADDSEHGKILQHKCMLAMTALFEGRNDKVIHSRVASLLPLSVLKQNLVETYHDFLTMHGGKYCDDAFMLPFKEQNFESIDISESLGKNGKKCAMLETGFATFILFQHLIDVNGPTSSGVSIVPTASQLTAERNKSASAAKFQAAAADELPSYASAWAFFRNHTKRVEILRDGSLERFYFAVPPMCDYLTQKTTDSVKWTLSRDGPAKKVRSLFSAHGALLQEMSHQQKLHERVLSRFFILRWLGSMKSYFGDAAFGIAVTVNILVLTCYEEAHPSEPVYSDLGVCTRYILERDVGIDVKLIINVCGVALVAFAALQLLFYVLNYAGLIATRGVRRAIGLRRLRRQQIALGHESDSDSGSESEAEQDDEQMAWMTATAPSVLAVPTYEDLKNLSVKQANKKAPNLKKRSCGTGWYQESVVRLKYWYLYLTALCTDGNILYLIAFTACAILGVIAHDYWFAPCLSDVVVRFEELKLVLRSVSRPIKALALTFLLFLIIEYYFAVLGFAFFRADFNFDDTACLPGDPNCEGQCRSLFTCFFTTFDQGFKNDGGLGGYLEPNLYQNDTVFNLTWGMRLLYDNAFNLLLLTVLLNIVFGVIIDTFAELRQEKQEKEDDMNNVCTVCSIERSNFDRFAKGFDAHVRDDHNMWNYIRLLAFLRLKPRTELTGVEDRLLRQVLSGDLSFFPLHQAMALNAASEGIDPVLAVHKEDEDNGDDGDDENDAEATVAAQRGFDAAQTAMSVARKPSFGGMHEVPEAATTQASALETKVDKLTQQLAELTSLTIASGSVGSRGAPPSRQRPASSATGSAGSER